MSAPATAVAVRENADGIGNLPAQVREQLQLRKMSNAVAGEIAKLNWGKQLDLDTRRAVADWGRQFRVDVTTEIHVLGGNVYLAAAFYLRRLSELIEAGLVEYAWADHVEDDPRLKKLGAQGEGEYSRRLQERIMHAIPDAAASAVVFRVKLRSMEKEVVGVKWCGGDTRKNDPVGDNMPVETSESRAARRAMRLLVSHVPQQVAAELGAIEGSAEIVSDRIKSNIANAKAVEAKHNAPLRALAVGAADDPYNIAKPSAEQIERLSMLLGRADIDDAERDRVARSATTAEIARKEIARLEQLIPPNSCNTNP